MYPRIALVLLTIIFICSCNTDSDSSHPAASESNISIAIPGAQSSIKLPQQGTWYAFINISGARNLTCDVQVDANTCELSVDTAAGQVSGRITLAADTYSFQVVWEYRDPAFINASRADGRWSIADAQKQVTVAAGQTSSLTYNEDDYNLPDTDGDRVSNLVELGNRNDPGNPNDPAKTIAVSDCRNVSQADCKVLIQTAGLKVGAVTQEASDTVAIGSVIRTNPAENTMVPAGSSVDLVVSLGPPDVPVPDCRNVPQATCETNITNAGLKVGAVSQAASDTIPAGNVISTNPVQGTMVAKGSNVDLVVSLGPPDVPVPDCRNVPQADCKASLTSTGLKVGAVTQEANATVATGNVIRTVPVQGTLVAKGSSVDLVVSSGPPQVSVPDCRNVPQADCQTSITNAGLKVGTVTQAASDTIPAGNVIRTVPVQGTLVAKGSSVDLVVSSGPPQVSVPDCRNVPQADCQTSLTSAGLKVGTVTQAASDTIPAGNVISTDPVQGTLVAAGSNVDLVVSSGPPQVSVPDCRNVPQADCEASLTSAGLKVGAVTQAASATIPAGNVISTNPVQGTLVAAGSSVDLVVSSGPPQVSQVPVPDCRNVPQANCSSRIETAGLKLGNVT
jgi:beta-lactam-binding protein with PASTA domain